MTSIAATALNLPPTSRLEVRDLRLVLALAAAGTTGRAASALHLTQPAVSRALLGIERRLGVALFERSPRGLEPTKAGRQLLDQATRMLVELSDLEHRVRAPATPPAKLRLVCECYTAYHWLPSALERLGGSMPGLEVSVAVEHTLHPVAALEAGDIDVALLTASKAPRRKVEERILFADEVVFVVSASHPLASKAALTPRDFRGQALLTSHVPTAQTTWFTDPVSGRGRETLRYQYLPLTEAIIDFARAGMGIGVLSEWMAAAHLRRGDLVAKRLASGRLERPWRIAWRKDVGDAAARLADVLRGLVPKGEGRSLP